jgi:hypothetical protein
MPSASNVDLTGPSQTFSPLRRQHRTAQTDLQRVGTLNQSTSSDDQQGYPGPPYMYAGLTYFSVSPTYLQ